jgi:hypothetical protein
MADKKEKTNTSPTVSQKPSSPKSMIATFGNDFFINLDKELEKYSTEHVKAYSAGTSESNPTGYFAMICDPCYTPRTNIIPFYKELATNTIPDLLQNGRMTMPDKKSNSYCLIYKDDLGGKIYDGDEDIALGWKADEILERLALPIISTLQRLQQRDVTHGNIRASNLYSEGGTNLGQIKLGECISVPASFNQPTVYEPVERAMALPLGRGEGSIKDDLYALGILLAMHVRNFDPLRGKSDDDIISTKVVNGSYSAVIGTSDRIGSGISELIRGLLIDDRKVRWTLDEVLGWLEGRRQSAKQPVKLKKAARGINFDGTQFYYARTFAHSIMKQPQEATALIENNEFMHWIERSLGNPDILQRINMAFETALEGGQGVGYWDRLLPRISTALDPNAPIRYRSLSFHMNALGNIMAESFVRKKGLNNFIDLFNNGTLYFWITTLADLNVDVLEHVQNFDKAKSFLRQKNMISGIERCLYFFNPSVHCLSDLVQDRFVCNPREYIFALERIAEIKKGSYPSKIIDKHAACFLASRKERIIDPYAYDLSSNEEYRNVLATLQILASIQKIEVIDKLPHLTGWVVKIISPLIKRYHDTEYQEKMVKEIDSIAEKGSLIELLALIENSEKVKKDQLMFRKAMLRYKEYKYEEDKLTNRLKNPKFFADKVGQEWAATISGIISTIVIIGFLMVHYGGGV